MHLQQSIYEKFRNGDPLTEYELHQGYAFFEKLSNELAKAGPVFLLAHREAVRVALGLNDYWIARFGNKKNIPLWHTMRGDA